MELTAGRVGLTAGRVGLTAGVYVGGGCWRPQGRSCSYAIWDHLLSSVRSIGPNQCVSHHLGSSCEPTKTASRV